MDNSPSKEFNFLFIDNGSTDGTSEFLKTVPNSFVIRNEQNIYVNPAWNQGFKFLLEHNTSEYFCLCNNDIIVGKRWLEPILTLFELRRNEFYIPVANTQYDAPPAYDSVEEFEKYVDKVFDEPLQIWPITKSFAGFCMFIRTEHIPIFYPITDKLKIIRGDDWIHDLLLNHCVYPMRVNQCAIHHFGSATQKEIENQPDFGDIKNRDSDEYERIKREDFPKLGISSITERKWKIKLL